MNKGKTWNPEGFHYTSLQVAEGFSPPFAV